jgi:hypothetical protein
MTNKINKERRPPMNAILTRPGNTNHWKGAHVDPETKTGHDARQSTDRPTSQEKIDGNVKPPFFLKISNIII